MSSRTPSPLIELSTAAMLEARLVAVLPAAGPVLAVDCDSAELLSRLRRKAGDILLFEGRPSVAQRHRAGGLSVYRSLGDDGVRRPFVHAIAVGAGFLERPVEDQARTIGELTRALYDGGTLAALIDARCVEDRPSFFAHLKAYAGREVRAHVTPLQTATALLTIQILEDRRCVARIEGSRDAEHDGSLAVVNAEILRQVDHNHPAVAFSSHGNGDGACADIVIRHYWPPNFIRPDCRYYIHVQPWEFGALPQSWVDGLTDVDEVWCYTEYVAERYREAGFPGDRIHVIALGFDPELYHPRAAEDERVTRESICVFTYVGGFIHRKGANLAIAAYAQAFSADDNVCLIIKSSGSSTFYSNEKNENFLDPLLKKPNAPRYMLLDQHTSCAELASLYRSSTALLAPFRGEGFGLPALEAMACGTPVIYTKGGAMDDFINDRTGYPVPSQRQFIRRDALPGVTLIQDGFLLEANMDELTATLRRVYEQPREALLTGMRAAEFAHEHFTWAHSARKVEERLAHISRELGLRG